MVMRKMGNTQTPTSTFSLEGDEYTMKTASTLKTSEVKFKLGQEFKETTMDGREAMTTFTLSGDVLTQVQKPAKGDEVTYVRTSPTLSSSACASAAAWCLPAPTRGTERTAHLRSTRPPRLGLQA